MRSPLRGFLFALLASMTWGTLPIAVQPLLAVMNAQTLVWYRLTVAGLGLLLFLALTKKLPKVTAYTAQTGKLFLLGVIGLSANFFLFSEALNYISPTTNQVLWQLAPFTMILCGVVIFKERFGLHQKIGLVLLLIGLLAFFNDRLGELLQAGEYALGIAISASAAIIWVCYGIAQKQLLKNFSSSQILMLIYLGCALILTPFSSPWQIEALDSFLLGCFLYCCLNTFIGYGAYAEALNHWEAGKVSVITVLLPIFTMIFSHLGHFTFPDIVAKLEMNHLSYFGALIVVGGSIFSVVGHKWLKEKNAESV